MFFIDVQTKEHAIDWIQWSIENFLLTNGNPIPL